MEGKIVDPYVSLRIPENSSLVSLADLEDIAAKLANAYSTFGEYLSASRALLSMRESLFERRKNRGLVNEGSNESERKALASMRSEPEYMMFTKILMLNRFIETRYFTYQRMLDVVTQMLTTKSVEMTRQVKDSDLEGRSL
jgi:hypothetical protein